MICVGLHRPITIIIMYVQGLKYARSITASIHALTADVLKPDHQNFLAQLVYCILQQVSGPIQVYLD